MKLDSPTRPTIHTDVARTELAGVLPHSSESEVVGWLQGLAAMGCPFMEMVPDGKKPKRKHEAGQRGLTGAMAWLQKGVPIGFLPMFPLWVLDADSAERVAWIEDILLDAGIVPLKVKTPGGGAHFYFQLPEGFRREGLKAHLLHPRDEDGDELAVDFKLGAPTFLAAPGTVRGGRAYEPASPWRTPPVADPRMFLPRGDFWKAPPRPFRVNPRPSRDRLAAARAYLRSRKTRVSICGKHGASTLAGVCSYLVSHQGLNPRTAYSLLTSPKDSWNSRCANQDGTRYPWSQRELWTACNAAVGTVSEASIVAFEHDQAKTESKRRLSMMVEILKASLTRPETERVPVEQVRSLFDRVGSVDGPDARVMGLTSKALGNELTRQGIKRILATHARIQCISGLDYLHLVGAVLDAKRAAMDQKGIIAGCPLLTERREINKQGSSLHPYSDYVDGVGPAASNAA